MVVDGGQRERSSRIDSSMLQLWCEHVRTAPNVVAQSCHACVKLYHIVILHIQSAATLRLRDATRGKAACSERPPHGELRDEHSSLEHQQISPYADIVDK